MPIMKILLLLNQAERRGKASSAPYKSVYNTDLISMSCYGHEIFSASPCRLNNIMSAKISCRSRMEFDAVNTLFYFLNLPYYCTNKYENCAIMRSNGVFVYVRGDT